MKLRAWKSKNKNRSKKFTYPFCWFWQFQAFSYKPKSGKRCCDAHWWKKVEFDSKLDSLMVKADQIATNSVSLSERVLRLENKHGSNRSFRQNDADFQRHLQGKGNSGRKMFKCKTCVANKVGYCIHGFCCRSTCLKIVQKTNFLRYEASDLIWWKVFWFRKNSVVEYEANQNREM